MSAFTNFDAVNITPAEGDGLWCLAKELHWDLGTKGSGYTILINSGFCFDGPTIPWWARVVFSPSDSRFWKAAAVHDYLLTVKDYSRASAAAEFYNALLADKVSPWRAKTMYLAVLVYTI